MFFLNFLLMNLHTNRHTWHKVTGFADIDFQVIVVTPCGEALYQSSVVLCKNDLQV